MRCKFCKKELNVFRKNKQFCCSYCAVAYYQNKEKLKYNCLYCGGLCYSRRRVCVNCLKLGISKKRLILNQRLKQNKYIY